ncbi:type II secretion system protein GspC [Chromatiaceae bacterium AAb-1]|nr:type II secretion system protein GspC [Chromatiaceae bacterium AAb-1]
MNLSLTSQHIGQRLKAVPLKPLRQAATLVLVVLLAWLLAKFSWQVLPVPAPAVLEPVYRQADTANTPATVNLNALLSFALFGKVDAQAEAAPAPVVSEAPKTQLNVKLTGVVAIQSDASKGSAIIESRGSEATYAVEDTIDGTNAVLKQVLEDRVLIMQAGRFETLMLDGVEYTRIAQANAGLGREDNITEYSDVVADDMAPSPEPMAMEVAQDVQINRGELLSEPMKFFDYIRVSPQHRDGQLAGYRLMPGREPALFNQLGLQRNDLAVEINGIRLNDMQQAMKVINELRDAREASIKIERDGETRDILVSLSQ